MNLSALETKMMRARVRLLLSQPFFGQVIMHLELKDATRWCKTAATDGKYLYYNTDFISALDPEELIFLLAHEVMHVVLDHCTRQEGHNKLIWNMASDFLVNFTLVKANIGKMPQSGLYDEKYTDELTVEQIYALLEKDPNLKVRPSLDEHMEASAGDKDADDSGVDGPVVMTAEELAEAKETMRSVIVQAQNTDPGKLPGGVRRLLDKMLASKINWREMLTSTLRSAVKYDFTYMRLSRRTWSSGLILPGADVMERVEVAAFLDGSASTTTEMITDFLAECKAIMNTFRDFKLVVATFDTQVYNVKEFTPSNASKIDSYDFLGGGGTRPSACWEYMKAEKFKPDRLIIFTDGAVGDDWGDPQYADTLFIIHSNDVIAPYGRSVVYAR